MTDDVQALVTEAIARQEAAQDIVKYAQLMQREGLLVFQHPPRDVHMLMINAFSAMLRGETDKILISTPPGVGKSYWCSVIIPTFILARNPKEQIICVSNSESLADQFAQMRREVIRTETWQQISDTKLCPDVQALQFMKVEAGGTIACCGVGSSLTGRRGTIGVLDDPMVDMQEALSPTQTSKIWTWFKTVFRTRIIGAHGVAIIGTRFSSGDLIGRCLDQPDEKWTNIRVPLICDDPTDDPLGRIPGQSLWPERYTEEEIRKAKSDPLLFQNLYQNKPLDEKGEWAPSQHLHLENYPEREMRITIGVDIGLTLGGDPSAIVVCGQDAQDGLHVLHLYHARATVEQTSVQLVDMARQWEPYAIYVDNDAASISWAQLCQQEAKRRAVPLPLQQVPMRNKNKEERASYLRAQILKDQFFIVQEPSWTSKLIDEFLTFPAPSGTDDIIDATGLCAKQMLKTSAPKKPEPPRPLKCAYSEINGSTFTTETFDELYDSHENQKGPHQIQRRRI